jgi:REP element-mobilizing transposase RayT
MLGRTVVRSLQREDDAGHTQTLAFVVMPDHLHWLVQLTGTRSLSVSVNTVKSFAARSINQIMGRSGRVWQAGYYDHALRDEEDLAAVARYIVANPLRAGLIRSVADYPLWDAIWV